MRPDDLSRVNVSFFNLKRLGVRRHRDGRGRRRAHRRGLSALVPTRIEKRRVQAMFSDIAPTYDLLNRLLSFGVDRLWRKRAVASLLQNDSGKEARFLDLATGTADVALEAHRQAPGARIVGVDFAYPMLARAKTKAATQGAPLSLIQGDGLSLPFPDGAFDGVIIAFGLRNFEDREAGLAETGRVLREGGTARGSGIRPPRGFVRTLVRLLLPGAPPRGGQTRLRAPKRV